jgi:uncharacterized protein YfeS
MDVIVDGKYRARMTVSYFDTYSPRLRFDFEDEHPEFGRVFMTKYFVDVDGTKWEYGYEGKTIAWAYAKNNALE